MANTSKARESQSNGSTNSDFYYEILGLERDATPDEINSAWKRVALKHHPDRHVTETEEEKAKHAQMFKECANAYECLSDSEKRLDYDMFGKASVPRTGAHDAEAFEQMFGVGSGAPKKRRTVGGALFVDGAKGQFFQRTWDISDVEKMRQEMAEGLPASQTQVAYDGASYTACTTLPHGAAWEVALVEASTELTITLIANDKEGDAPSTLRIERTFALPPSTTSAWDLGGAEVDVSDAGVLRVTMVKVAGDLAGASSPSTPHAMDGAMPAPRTPLKQKRGVRRAKRPQASGMRAGFLNSKPRGAAAELGASTDQMEADAATKAAPPRVVKEPSLRACSPVSVREMPPTSEVSEDDEQIGQMMRAQVLDGLAAAEPCAEHDPDALDRGVWPDDVVLPEAFCPLGV